MNAQTLEWINRYHDWTLAYLDDGRYSVLCMCGWVSEPSNDLDATSDAVVGHYRSMARGSQ